MYNFSTASETRITTSGSAIYPAIYGDRIVWMDGRNGNPDIYMFTLASVEVPPLDSNNTGTDTGADNETQIPDNESGNGDDTGTDNGTKVPDNCPSKLTPLDRAQALKEYVECTYKCHVKTKAGLATLLDSSMCHYEYCDNAKAVSMLKSFIHLVGKMKVCKQISAEEADYMIREANKIIDQIEMH